MKFETMVGERGITLSGGQKQRTAISRAVIRDPKILILDDALSSVDTYTEEQILNELKKVMRGRTSILISHRVSTVKEADEIIVLDHGEIVERGSHDELLERGGYYAELHKRQLLEEELAVRISGLKAATTRLAITFGPTVIAGFSPRSKNMQEEEVLGKAYDSRLMRRLVTYLRPYKTAVACCLCAYPASNRCWRSRSPG